MAGFILKSLVLSERALVDQLLRLVVKKHSKWCKAQILQKKNSNNEKVYLGNLTIKRVYGN